MQPVKMTRAEYQAKYGTQPSVSSSTPTTTPVKMTRAQYEATYGGQQQSPGIFSSATLEGKPSYNASIGGASTILPNIAKTFGNIPSSAVSLARNTVVDPIVNTIKAPIEATKLVKEQGFKKGAQLFAQGFADTVNKGASSVYSGAKDLLQSAVQNPVQTAKDIASGVAITGIEDPLLIPSLLYAPGKLKGTGAAEDTITTIAKPFIENPVVNRVKNIPAKAVASAQPRAIDALEQTYKDIYSGTALGKKNLSKIESKVASLDKAGTTGRTPMRVLAEEGIIPNRAGTKLDTFEQAQEYRNKITPLREANKMALKESGLATAPRSLDELQAKAIQYAKTPENINSGRFNKMEKEIIAEFDLLKKNYPSGSVPLDVVDDIKSARWDNVFKNKSLVEADALRKDSEYAIAKALQKDIEEVTTKLGNPEVAQLNREIGDRLGASKFLEDLNGKTIKGGRLLKYVTTAIGASAGNTIPGKIIGAMGGNIVGELIIANNVSSPVKRLLLRNLKIKNPEAYTNTIKWLEKQNLDRETRLLLPSRPAVIPIGGEVNGQKVDASGKLVSPKQGPMQVVPAQKNPVTVNPSTGKFQTSYNSQSKSPISQQIKPAITKDANIVNTSVAQPKKRTILDMLKSNKGSVSIPNPFYKDTNIKLTSEIKDNISKELYNYNNKVLGARVRNFAYAVPDDVIDTRIAELQKKIETKSLNDQEYKAAYDFLKAKGIETNPAVKKLRKFKQDPKTGKMQGSNKAQVLPKMRK